MYLKINKLVWNFRGCVNGLMNDYPITLIPLYPLGVLALSLDVAWNWLGYQTNIWQSSDSLKYRGLKALYANLCQYHLPIYNNRFRMAVIQYWNGRPDLEPWILDMIRRQNPQ
jgi:hypothetical protein